MQANELTISTFLEVSKTCFVIPVYQRNYSWKESNCKQLIKDIEKTEGKQTHFIGSIVYLKDKDQDFALKDFLIIDGQQRLTTITIALIALYVIYKEKNDYRHKDIKEYIINVNNEDSSENLKLITNQENDVVLNYLFHGKAENRKPKNLETNQININYTYFDKYFRTKTDDQLQILLKSFLKLDIVSIALDKGRDNPQKIFESLNSTGVNLTKSDLIRNFILMGLSKDKQNEIFNIWKQIEENTAIIHDTETMELKTMGLNTIELKTSEFIRDFITFKTKIIPVKDQVYIEYKTNYEKITQDYELLKAHILELKKFSEYYRSLLRSEHQDKDIQQQIMYINKLQTTVSYPFLLSVLDNYQQELLPKEYVMKILDTIQSFVWRRSIVDASTNTLNKLFSILHDQRILLGSSPKKYFEFIVKELLKNDNFPTDEKVHEDLKTKNIYTMKAFKKNYLFLKLERHKNKEIVNIDNLSVEHIFPQNATTHWRESMSNQDYTFLKNKLNTLANLTLVATNSALGNRNFIDKRDLNDKNEEKGYKFSKLWLNSKLKTYDKWTQTEYEDRFNELYQRFIEVWQFPYDYNEEDAHKKTFTLADQFHYKSANIIKIKYNDFLTDCHKDNDFYRAILEKIFVVYKDNIIHNQELLKKISISKEKKDVSYQPFLDDYHMGTRMNNQVKINQLRSLFSALEIPFSSLEITIE